jgi:putative restriction endonuclease
VSGDASSRGGRQAYFATAKVDRIEPDPIRPDHFYAFVSGYLEFERPVSFKEGEHYFESALARADGKTNKGAFGRAVRFIPDIEYELIVQAGFVRVIREISRSETQANDFFGFAEAPLPYDRPIVERMISRPFREAAFAVGVKQAYTNTCAMTGISIINGGGRAEVQAAHILPVAHRGPDSIRNGLALSGTIHWMFDRGLVSIDEDYSILVARGRLPDTVAPMLRNNLLLPDRLDQRPHARFLRYHRDQIFKG